MSKLTAVAATKDIEDEVVPITDLHKYVATVKGITPILWNKLLADLSKPNLKSVSKESDADREKRIWRDKVHVTDGGRVYWPAENCQEALIGGAKYWGFKLGQKGLYNVIARGTICEAMVVTDQHGQPVYKDSDCLIPFEKMVKRTDGKRVFVIRPMMAPGWLGTLVIHVWDARLSRDIIFNTCRFSGQYNGLGDWRKYYGRFEVVDFNEIEKG